jgi:predicted nucleic acid-binding protein
VILVDTPIWIDHLRAGDEVMARLLSESNVLMHPFIKGEIALGHLHARARVIRQLDQLPQAIRAHDDEVMRLIEAENLFASGIGYVDAHLVASVRLTGGALLWTRDKRLGAVAERLGVAARVAH